MPSRISPGERVPQASLAQVIDGEIVTVSTHALLTAKRAVFVGVPGVFTPLCSRVHIPEFAANATRLRASGYDLIACVAPDNPWALAAWAEQIDPQRRLTFLSDGNLALARALGATTVDYKLFLGETSARYMLITEYGVVQRFTVEAYATELTCTRADDALQLE